MATFRTRTTFVRLLRLFSSRAPGYTITLNVGPPENFPEERSFAYTVRKGPKRYDIFVARDIGQYPIEREEGVLAHEFGHVYLWETDSADHSERDADTAAEAIFKLKISYDGNDVQTTGRGVRPRPAHLDQ